VTARPAAALLAAVTLARAAVAVAAAPAVLVVDDETRLRREDGARARTVGRELAAAGAEVELDAFRGETVAFQVVLLAGATPVGRARLSVVAAPPPADGVTATAFREHYVAVARRSRNDQLPNESLGWQPGARPPDAEMLGELPDALLPIDVDARPITPGPDVPAGKLGAFWVDVAAADEAPPGDRRLSIDVSADGARAAAFTVRVRVQPPRLPYRATGVFAYYEPERIARRVGPLATVEPQLWQLLHGHQIDALAPLADPAEAERLRAAYDGSLFRAAAGYQGPGAGAPPEVAAIGAYGVLGAPTQQALDRFDQIAARLPPGILDRFLYAIDERCASPIAADWKAAMAARPLAARVPVAQTCDLPPARQPVDIALLSGQAFGRDMPGEARAAGRRAWIYNGRLPHTGTLLLDADPRGLTANGWIAAAAGIERWFYWESTYWDDDNRGGHGPIDPFLVSESFHNAAGDSALGDGLLLYPGKPVGYPGVLPSLRLKAVRRGIEDAGIIALAAREHAGDAARLVMAALPAALDEVPDDQRASWEVRSSQRFGAARAALRALVTREAPMSRAEVRAAFAELAAARRRAIPLAPAAGASTRLRGRAAAAGALAVPAIALFVGWAVARRRRRPSC
jgi:hypothetical protein